MNGGSLLGLCLLTCTQLSQMEVAVALSSTQGVLSPQEDNTGAVAIWRFLVRATQGAAEKAAALPVSYRRCTWHYP